MTLGLPGRVVHAIPLESVRFDLPTGAGPSTFWDDFVEAFVNAVDFVVQGLVLIGAAIADFFVQAVAFLGELGMAVIGAIGAFLGQVAEAVEHIGEVLAEFASFVLDFISSGVHTLIDPILSRLAAAIDAYAEGVLNALKSAMTEYETTGDLSSPTILSVDQALSGSVFLILLTIVAGLVILMTVLIPFSFTFGFILVFAVSLVVLLIIEQLFQLDELQGATNPGFQLGISLVDLVQFSRSFVESGQQLSAPPSSETTPSAEEPNKDTIWPVLSIVFGVFGLFFGGAALAAQALPLGKGVAFGIVFGIVSLIFAIAALLAVYTPTPTDDFILGAIGFVSGGIAIILSLLGFRRLTTLEAKAFAAVGITLGTMGLVFGLFAMTG